MSECQTVWIQMRPEILFGLIGVQSSAQINSPQGKLSLEGKALIPYLSRGMSFPTMWYVRPAKAQTSLCICTV